MNFHFLLKLIVLLAVAIRFFREQAHPTCDVDESLHIARSRLLMEPQQEAQLKAFQWKKMLEKLEMPLQELTKMMNDWEAAKSWASERRRGAKPEINAGIKALLDEHHKELANNLLKDWWARIKLTDDLWDLWDKVNWNDWNDWLWLIGLAKKLKTWSKNLEIRGVVIDALKLGTTQLKQPVQNCEKSNKKDKQEDGLQITITQLLDLDDLAQADEKLTKEECEKLKKNNNNEGLGVLQQNLKNEIENGVTKTMEAELDELIKNLNK